MRHDTLGPFARVDVLQIEREAIRHRFVAEGNVQASLRLPDIVAGTDVLIVDRQAGLLTERIEGSALENWLETYRPTVGEGLKLFRGILAGVERVYRAGLVHGDLKPGNVLLDSADGIVIPQVADFALAKVLADEESGQSQTRSGRYTNPESLVPGLPKRVRDTIRACPPVERDLRPPDRDAVPRMLYGDDDALAGDGKIDGVSDLRPGRRARLARSLTGGDSEALSAETATAATSSAPRNDAHVCTRAPRPAPAADPAVTAVTASAPSAAAPARATTTSATATTRRSTTKTRAFTEAAPEPVAPGSLRTDTTTRTARSRRSPAYGSRLAGRP